MARYPDQDQPTPQNHPDGSWSCGDSRKLTPDQSAEVKHGHARIREIGERDIVPGMLAVEAADPGRRLAGFEHHIKGEDRLKEKIADRIRSTPGITPTQALGLIADAVRFTYQYSEATYVRGVETFGTDLRWAHSSIMREYEHGDLGNKFIPITEDEANQIVERIRSAAAGG